MSLPETQTFKNLMYKDVGCSSLLLVGFISVNLFIVTMYNPQPEYLAVKLFIGGMYVLSLIALIFIGNWIDKQRS